MKFYLGAHRPYWLWSEEFRDVPLFVSHVTLRERKSPFPKAVTNWALDSGGFSELDRHGKWTVTPEEYVTAVRRYATELGRLDWASPQDWMCEPWMIDKTGLSIEEHQARTVENYLTLRELAPDLPFVPVLQGWELDDYARCVEMYAAAGVGLTEAPTVGVGSVCRRQYTDSIGEIMQMLSGLGLQLHGYGVKSAGIAKYGDLLQSADSMAWSYGGRRRPDPDCPKSTCANCSHYALSWRDDVLKGAV